MYKARTSADCNSSLRTKYCESRNEFEISLTIEQRISKQGRAVKTTCRSAALRFDVHIFKLASLSATSHILILNQAAAQLPLIYK